MAIMRAQCSFQYDTAFVRDAMVITPHFDVKNPAPDWQTLANDLRTALASWSVTSGGELKVKVYDAQAPVPSFPKAEAVARAGTIGNSNYPRELAVCLSYYAERNAPRLRGRLYTPIPVTGASATAGIRPVVAQRQKAADLVPIFTNLGGIDVDWGVWSRITSTFRKATNWYVDDEWDVMRSRGLRATTRLAGTTGE